MAFHHLGGAILALSTLLGILGSLHASDTTLIPLDQLTVEQAYLEVHLIGQQLLSPNPPNMTAEQKDIFDRLYYHTVYGIFKPNDSLPTSLHQLMSEFRQAFKNWNQPLKPGTVEYQLKRGLGLIYLYQDMVRNVHKAVNKDRKHYQGNKEVMSGASSVLAALVNVYLEVKEKFDNSSSLVKPEDMNRLEVAIKVARDAVLAMPRVDENGKLVPGTSPLPSKQSTSSGILSEESQDKPDVGGSLPAGVLMIPGSSSKQTTSSALLLPDKSPDKPDGPVESSGEFSSVVKDSAKGGEDSVGPDAVPSDGPPGGNPIQPDGQLPSGSAGSMPGGWSSSPPRKSRNKLFPLLKQPYVWGSALVLAAGAGYYFLNSHPSASASGDLYSLSTSTLNFATVASEGSSLFWYIILPLGGLVALVALGYWCWYCIKTRGTPPEDEAKAATEISKRASQKSQQLASTTTDTSSSAGTTSA